MTAHVTDHAAQRRDSEAFPPHTPGDSVSPPEREITKPRRENTIGWGDGAASPQRKVDPRESSSDALLMRRRDQQAGERRHALRAVVGR